MSIPFVKNTTTYYVDIPLLCFPLPPRLLPSETSLDILLYLSSGGWLQAYNFLQAFQPIDRLQHDTILYSLRLSTVMDQQSKRNTPQASSSQEVCGLLCFVECTSLDHLSRRILYCCYFSSLEQYTIKDEPLLPEPNTFNQTIGSPVSSTSCPPQSKRDTPQASSSKELCELSSSASGNALHLIIFPVEP